MSIRRTSFLTPGLLLLLAAGAAVDASRSAAQAADLSVRPYLRSYAAASDARAAAAASDRAEVTGTINSHAAAPAGDALQTVPVSHARSARTHFNEARAAMERALLLRGAAPNSD